MNTSDSSFFIAKVKIILLGDPTVGKTSIIAAIRQAEFQDKQEVDEPVIAGHRRH